MRLLTTRFGATGFVLGAVGMAGAAFAGPPAVDLSLPAGAPLLTDPAPVQVLQPALDVTNPRLTQLGGGADNAPQQGSLHVTTGGSTTSDYIALVLDRDSGDNLFIKVQQQDGSGKFSHVGFYHANNGGGWTGMTGGAPFFSLAAADQFTSALMTVTHDGAGNVELRFDNVVGGNNNQVYMRGGWTPRSGAASGMGGWTGTYPIDNFGVAFTGDTVCDTFNRPNGSLGGNWVVTDGTAGINTNAARCDSFSRAIYIGSCGDVVDQVAADLEITDSSLGYGALILNNDGDSNLFVKLQGQTAGTVFSHIGFYDDNNGGSYAGINGGAGFFALAAGDEFTSGRARLMLYQNGAVRLVISNIDGGNGVQAYQRGGWGVRSGTLSGIGGFSGNVTIDNFSIGPGICDNFNRPNGGLGSEWTTTNGTTVISSQMAVGSGSSFSMFTGTCQTACYPDCNGDGLLNLADFGCFQTNFAIGCP